MLQISEEKKITFEEALSLSTKKEGHFFDRKALAIKGNRVQKIATAFANADGGEFYIGIADDDDEPNPKLRWQGSDKIENYNSHIQALNYVVPDLDGRIEFLNCLKLKGIIMRVFIEKSTYLHKTSDGTIYVRMGAQSLPVKDHQKIQELEFAKGIISFEDQILTDILPEEIVDSIEIQNFLKDYAPLTDPLSYVMNQNLLDKQSMNPKVAAILLFHENPSVALPRKCAVKIALYETKEEDPEREHLKNQYTIEGCLYPLIHKTIDKIKNLMADMSVWTFEGLKKVNYPPETIWEIVVNALIHRVYSISDDVKIFIYENRIEVISPGKLPGFITINNILDSRYSRNPRIVRTLNWYKDPPNKDLGEGLNTAFQKMKEFKLKDPMIYEKENYVVVVIPHTPLANPSEAILEFLKKNAIITNRQARDITGIKSENSIKKEFYKLAGKNLIERVPELKGAKSAWKLKKPEQMDLIK